MSGKAVIRATQVTRLLPEPPAEPLQRRATQPTRDCPLSPPSAAPTALGITDGRWQSRRGRRAAARARPGCPRSPLHTPPPTPARLRRLDRPQMFTKNGQAAKVSLVKEIIIGAGMGTVLGFWWQT